MAALAPDRQRRRSRTAGELLADLRGLERPPSEPTQSALRNRELVEADGDPRPPTVRLRQTLEQARADGLVFRAVWRDAVEDALLGLDTVHSRDTWRSAFWNTRDGWEAAWRRTGPRLSLGNLLMAVDDS